MKKAIFILITFVSGALLNAQTGNYEIARAEAHVEEGRYQKAITECEKALSITDDYRIYLILGKAYKNIGNADKAIKAFAKASYLAPGSGDFSTACLYSTLGDSEKALLFLETHLKSEYKLTEREILLNPELKILEGKSGWKKLWIRDWYSDMEEGLAEARYLADNERLSELEDLISYLKPKYEASAGIEYIMALYSGLTGDKKSELAHYRNAAKESDSDRFFLQAYINTLIEQREYFEAVEATSKALDLYPSEKEFILQRAKSLKGAGNPDEAMKMTLLYLEISPNNEQGLALAGDIAFEKRSYSDALKFYSSGIELYPGNPDNYINRANVYSNTSTWEFAISDYSMALDLDPRNAEVYFNKAYALLKTGNRDDACRDYRMALKYGNKKASAAINKNCIR